MFIELYAREKGPPAVAGLDGEDISSVLRLTGLFYLFFIFLIIFLLIPERLGQGEREA